ncbi:hypothetical protein [Marinobacterium jannaschii]|uniref:hypothetical protein n=1 Tax=Marinobacterium jannaschii TaxID=64970 RepID=UPI000486039D|nr:hypothetical protein [Marinobacterium jannaschii]
MLMESALHRLHRTMHPGNDCCLELPVGDSGVFVCNDGSLLTVFKLLGTSRWVGHKELKQTTKALTKGIKEIFKNKIHDLQFVFEADPDETAMKDDLSRRLANKFTSARHLGIDSEALYQEQIDLMAKDSQFERCWVTIWTGKKGSSLRDIPEELTALPAVHDAQSPGALKYHHQNKNLHEAAVDQLVATMKSAYVGLSALTSLQAVRDMFSCVSGNNAGQGFTPGLFGGEQGPRASYGRPPSNMKYLAEDHSLILPEKVGFQLWTSDPEYDERDASILHVGDRSYRNFLFSSSPFGYDPFSKVVRDLKEASIPYRMSWFLKGDALGMSTVKYIVASMLSLVPLGSIPAVRREMERVRKHAAQTDEATGWQMSILTWADNRDINLLRERSQKLARIVSSWEGAALQEDRHDSLSSFCASVPAYLRGNPAPAAIAPMRDAFWYLPVTRPVSPVEDGGVLLSNGNGRLIQFQPMDPQLMEHHVYLVAGEPGFGKSLLCNLLCFVLATSCEQIPYIAISDVGTSSKGLIKLLASTFPPHLKHLVQYRRQKNREEDAINPFDTPLALTRPLSDQMAKLQNFCELVLTDDKTGELPPNVSGLLQQAIPLVYKRKDDQESGSEPNRFRESVKTDPYWPVIERAMDAVGIHPTKRTTWWEITRTLMKAGYTREAGLAQRFAVPLLSDIAQVMSQPELREIYRDDVGGIPLTELVSRRIGEVLERYRVLRVPTRQDLGEARIVSFDLEEVCPRASKEDVSLRKQSAIFYGLTSALLVSRFFWNKSMLQEIPEEYRAYYSDYIDSIRQTPNLYFADEQQRFAGIPQADEMNIQITREGRKLKVGVMLASQGVTEFPEDVVTMSTAQFVLGFGDKSIEPVKKAFKLNDTEAFLLTERIPRPGKHGSYFLLRLDKTNEHGNISQLVNLKMGPQIIWGLSTNGDDDRLRSAMEAEFTEADARRILARLYPQGSILPEIKRREIERDAARQQDLINIDKVGKSLSIFEEITMDTIQKGKSYFMEQTA